VRIHATAFAALLVALFVAAFAVPPSPQSASIAPPAVYEHDAKGLELQYQPFIEAYASGSSSEIDRSLAIFSIPNPKVWFAKYFAKEQLNELVSENEHQVGDYQRVLLNSMKLSPAGTTFRVRSKIWHRDPTATMEPRRDAIFPSIPLQLEQFFTEWRPVHSGSGRHFSMLVDFVYVDGAFRYVGRGALPFWSAPAATPTR
jgi:hypothetical protein